MPYIVSTSWYPTHKNDEAVKTYMEAIAKYPPSKIPGKLIVPVAVTTTKKGIKTMRIREIKTNEGLVENIYTLKIINMDKQARTYQLTADGLEGMVLVNKKGDVHVESGEVINLPVRIQVDPVNLKSVAQSVQFTLQALDKPELKVTETGRFIGPAK